MLNIGKKEEIREGQALIVEADSEKILAGMGKENFYAMYSAPFNLESNSPLEVCYGWLMKEYYLDHANKEEYFLDVGCGTGKTVLRMERYGYIATGIEPSAPRLHFCHKLQRIYKNKNIRFYAGIGERLPFCGKWFDVVHSTMVLEMARAPITILAEMLRVGKVVTGIIHMGDQEGSPHHSWHMTEERIVTDLDWLKNTSGVIDYKVAYFNKGHARCAAFIIFTKFNKEPRRVPVSKLTAASSMVKEWEDSYYEALLEYGVSIVEDPVMPIVVIKKGDSYHIAQDGVHRVNALKRTEIEKVKVAVVW